MTDGLSLAYASLLDGSYDCIDRIVLNGYYRFAQTPPGFRLWWRELKGSDADLDDTHINQMAAQFSRRLRLWSSENDIPMKTCGAGQQRHEIAERCLEQTTIKEGLFLIVAGRAQAPIWEVLKGGYIRRKKPYPYVNHFSFHILDPKWGHVTIKISSYPPFPAQIILNGHEYLAREARRRNVTAVVQEGNCFTHVQESDHLAVLSKTLLDELLVGQLTAVCDRWIYSCVECAINSEERERSQFQYDYSTYQLEYSRNLIFTSGAQMTQVAEALFDRNRSRMDVKRLKTIFGKKDRPHHRKRKRPVWQVTAGRPAYDLSVFKVYCGKLAVKLYTKGERVLRVEAAAINTRELRCGRTIERFSQTVNALKGVLERFLESLIWMDSCFVSTQTCEQLAAPSSYGKTRIGGIDINRPRMGWVAKALVALSPVRGEFTASDLARYVQRQVDGARVEYGPRQAAYDLQKFCAKGLVIRHAGRRRYRTTPEGLRFTTGLLILRDRVLNPLLSAVASSSPKTPSFGALSVDDLYRQLRGMMSQLLDRFGFSAVYLQQVGNASEVTA